MSKDKNSNVKRLKLVNKAEVKKHLNIRLKILKYRNHKLGLRS